MGTKRSSPRRLVVPEHAYDGEQLEKDGIQLAACEHGGWPQPPLTLGDSGTR
eukprot:CAMPEP_0204204126 /NCGR_PEP_ID=MMETSP0361-20130328/69405_1 /ASSEMBLY_ACC=CAM_ASM_000343 /TAXON_ID=268821 /ORGANISM="Scrippsiella Hangoei, Strain SHTV-5" /LENGTH=51 /DNA_ID=CAMNT_0051167177 /DNA_START=40 /DNA_END=192 /DNA_ORIENTATION=+